MPRLSHDTVQVNRCIIHGSHGKVLLLQRAANDCFGPSCWEFPGGKAEPQEDTETAIRREVFEETGLVIASLSAVLHTERAVLRFGRHAGYPFAINFFSATTAQPVVQLSSEHQAFLWDQPDELLRYGLTTDTEQAVRALGPDLRDTSPFESFVGET